MESVDFAALLSRNHRPARVAELKPQESFKPINKVKKEKKRNKHGNNSGDLIDSSHRELVLKLVSKTPVYAQNAQTDERDRDAELIEMVKSMPKAPDNEWNSLPPSFHQIELENWEEAIEWEGYKPADSGPNKTLELLKQQSSAQALLSERRNPYLDALRLDDIDWDGVDSQSHIRAALNVPLILELGTAGQSIARHVLPVFRPIPFSQTDAYIHRAFEHEFNVTSTAELSKGTLHADKEKMEKLIEERQKKRAQMAKDKTNRVTEAMGTLELGGGKGRTITSSLMGPGGTERTGRPTRGNTGVSVHDVEYIEQLDMVYSHIFAKPELNAIELRQYQRPKLPLTFSRRDRTWQFQIRFIPSTKKESTNNPGSYQSMMTHAGAASQAKIRCEADLNPTEGKLVLLEYCEEKPPIQLTKGMGSKIINYYRGDKSRCPVSAGGGDRPTRRKRSDSTTQESGPTGKVERPPRLVGPTKKTSLEDWIGKPPKRKREDQSEKQSINILPEGVTEILHPKIHGPFIGEVEDGITQTGFINNSFVAPMFRHEPESTDFLMILGKRAISASKRSGIVDKMSVVLRSLPQSIFTVGQVEPRERGLVHGPSTSGERTFMSNFVSYMIARNLTYCERHEGRGLRFDEITAMFANSAIQSNGLRQRIKAVALYDKNTQIWESRPISDEIDDYPGVEALGRRIAPEAVAAYEMACSAARRLQDIGIHLLQYGSGNVQSIGVAMFYLAGQLNAAREISRKMRKMVESAKTPKNNIPPTQIALYEKASAKLEIRWKELRRKHEVARFIYEELQLSPWHLTFEFIDVHKHAHGTGMMELTGLADPSGGEGGYSFLREAEKVKATKTTTNNDGALNAQIKKITGTDNDLRKLTMKQMASLLRSYGMPEKEIVKLKRWDRVHVIRDLSTKAASDGMGDGLERFARGEKLKLSEQKQFYQERIQEIWRRQRTALSTDAGDLRNAAQGAGATSGDENEDILNDRQNASKQKNDVRTDSDSDDSDENDDLAAMLEDDFIDDRQANQVLASHHRGDGEEGPRPLGMARGDESETKDARALAALRRQREEEEKTKEGFGGKGNSIKASKSMLGRKVVRKRIIKTYPDGRQTTTFKFILSEDEVEKVATKKRGPGEEDKMKKTKIVHKQNDRALGHSFFEEDDNFELTRSHVNRRSGKGRKPSNMTMKGKLVKRTGAMGKSRKNAAIEKRLKKRKKEQEEADVYMAHAKRNKGPNSRRERSAARQRLPHVIFSEKLESIRLAVEKRPTSSAFHRPVDRRAYPHYYEVIPDPIDLQTIRDKNQKYEYKTSSAFLKEFDLMKNNAIKFNGANTFLGQEGVRIYDYVKQVLESEKSEISKMEEAVVDQMGGKKKKKKSSLKSSSPMASGSDTGLLVDGVALGDISKFESDTDSDDSSTGFEEITG